MRFSLHLLDETDAGVLSGETQAQHPTIVTHWTESYRASARHLVEHHGFPVSFLESVEISIARMLHESEA